MKKFLKILGIIFLSLIIFICSIIIYFNYFFNLKTFETTIKNKVYKISNRYLYFDSAKISFKHGIGVKIINLKILNKDNKTTFFSSQNSYINFKIIDILRKKINCSKITFENGELLLNFKNNLNDYSKKTNNDEKKRNKITFPDISLKYLNLKNFKVHYIDNHLNIDTSNLNLTVKNFSFANPFPFELTFISKTDKNLIGHVSIKGNFNFNRSFSPEKMHLNAHIIATNLYGDQFYSYFIKEANFEKFTGNIKKIDSFYDGNFKGKFSSQGYIELKNFIIKHEKFEKNVKTKILIFKYNYSMDEGNLNLPEFSLNIDNKLYFKGNFFLKNYKKTNRLLLLTANSNKINIIDGIRYSPYKLKFISIKKGVLKINKFTLKNSILNINLTLNNFDGNYKFLKFHNLSGQIIFNNNQIKYSGNLNAELEKKFKIKDIEINSLQSHAIFQNLEIPLKNVKNISGKGKITFQSQVSYKNYKNINIFSDNTTLLNKNIISFLKIIYNDTIIKAKGKFTFKDFNLTANIEKIGNDLLKKLKIKEIKNYQFSIELKGNYAHPKLSKILLNFNNGNISYDNYTFSNIFGNINCTSKNNQCKINNLKIKFNNYQYLLNGKITKFLNNKNRKIYLNIKSNGIDKTICKKLDIDVSNIKNATVNSSIILKFSPKFNVKLKYCKVSFTNSNFKFLDYNLKNITGNLLIKEDKLILKDISLISNDINYKINGMIKNLYSNKKRLAQIFINANGIDKIVIEKLKLGKESIKNVNVYSELNLKFYPDISIQSIKSNIIFKNSLYHFDNYTFSHIKGKININKENLIISNLKFTNKNSKYEINGKFFHIFNKEKIYGIVNIKTNEINAFVLNKLGIKSHSIKNLNINLKLKLNFYPKFSLFIPDGLINFKGSNFKNFKNIIGTIKIKNNDIYIPNLKSNYSNGELLVNGDILKNYIKLKIFGKNIKIVYKENHKLNSKPKKEIKKENIEKNTEKIAKLIKKLKNFSTKFNGEIEFNFKNISLKKNRLKTFTGKIKLNNKKLFLSNFKGLTYENGKIDLNTFLFDFSKKTYFFSMDGKIDNFDFYDLSLGKISGKAKDCLINLNSKFKHPEKFLKNLNGFIFIYVKNGYIYKFTFLNNIFSILNVYQFLKFKLPNINSKGLKYKIIAGTFNIKNGILKTEKSVLISDSINLGLKGKANLPTKKIKGELVVQPLQTVGNIISKIPVFGYIFGKKIILFYFKLSGTYDKPKLMIQPTKTITKKTFNIFKNIFTLPKDLFTNPKKVFLPGMSSK